MKHLDKALIGAGAALLLSGGVAAAALGPGDTGASIVSALPGGVTLFVDHGPFGGASFLATAATYLGITEAELRTQLRSGKSLADVAAANGKTRDGLIAALTQAATTQIATLVDTRNPFPHGGPRGVGRGEHLGFGMDGIETASTYLGITEADLRTQLQGGKTLGQIADATAGKSRDGLIGAIVTAETSEIDAAQTAGKITADQATRRKTDLTARVTTMVDATGPMGRGGFGHGPRGR